MIPRALSPSDTAPLADLWHAAWQETQAPFVPADLAALRTKPDFHRRLVAMGDRARTIGPVAAPLGFCAIKGDHLDQLFLAPQARGTGAAAKLIADAEDRLRADGVVTAYLDCLQKNTAAIRFYQKMGWTAQTVQPVPLDTSAGSFMLECLVFSKLLVRI